MNNILLSIENLTVEYNNLTNKTKAVNKVSFNIEDGQTYGLVGESGSGKTTIGKACINLCDISNGTILFEGKDVKRKLSKKERDYLTKNIQMIFQDHTSSLNPRMKIKDIIAQGLDAQKLYKSKKEREEKIYNMMYKVGLNKEYAECYPHQLSGGQRQRVGIARALITNPKLVIADECISALDVSVQAQIINLMKDLQKETNCAYLFITHDLSMVRYLADRIGVLHYGYLVEEGTKNEIFNNPSHPYTKSLISSVLQANPIIEKNRKIFKYSNLGKRDDYEKQTFIKLNDNHFILANK